MGTQQSGAMWMLGSALMFSLHLALMKHASIALHPLQMTFIRNVMATLVLGGLFVASGPIIIRNIPLFLLRAGLGTGAGLALNFANANAPLAAVALLFHARIFPLTALAGLALGERISPGRWLGIIIGFAGIAIVVSPGNAASGWSIGLLAALAAALLSSGSQIAVKALTGYNAPLTVAAFSQLAFAILSAPTAMPVWTDPAPADIAVIGVAATASALAALAAAKAFSLAPASVVSPVDNTGIILSAGLGFVIFGEIPGWNVVAGAILVIWATYYVVGKT